MQPPDFVPAGAAGWHRHPGRAHLAARVPYSAISRSRPPVHGRWSRQDRSDLVLSKQDNFILAKNNPKIAQNHAF